MMMIIITAMISTMLMLLRSDNDNDNEEEDDDIMIIVLGMIITRCKIIITWTLSIDGSVAMSTQGMMVMVPGGAN